MRYQSLPDFLSRGRAQVGPGPMAIILMEDQVEADSTIRHHAKLGFDDILVFAPDYVEIDMALEDRIARISFDTTARGATETVINRLNDAFTGRWLYYCYNAEYLYFPFCETRNIREMTAFMAEERRSSVLTYVIDLYAADLERHPNAVSPEDAHLDLSGYYALARHDDDGQELERQLDFFGGLRWRFEQHVPWARRRIDRIGIFRAAPDLQLDGYHSFNIAEYNTYACPWHNNLTAAICSFRTAKALKTNPGSTYEIADFTWHNSGRFEWQSQQLMDLGLMEPGQWF